MRRLRLAALFLLYWSNISPAWADIDPTEYEPKTSVRSEKERNRLKTIFEADRKIEAEQQKLAAEAEAQRLAAEKAAWEALPYPVRLTLTRCTGCHVADDYMNQRHNRIGWELSVLRMQYMNNAPLAVGERGVIAAHLTESYPATGSAALIEALLQLAATSPVWLFLIWKATRSQFGRRR